MNGTRRVLAVLVAVGLAATTAGGAAGSPSLGPDELAHVRTIRSDLSARYGPELVVTEASSTGVLESYTLLSPRLDGARVVLAEGGAYFAICTRGATCPYPTRARRPAAFQPRRLALELAVRTLSETTADLVVVSLPTERYVVLVVERAELVGAVGLPALARALRGHPGRAPAAWLRRIVDRVTRPRLFVPLALEPTPSGRDTLTAMPLWPGDAQGALTLEHHG